MINDSNGLKGKIVIPGEVVRDGDRATKNTFIEDKKIKSMVFGLEDQKGNVIALTGRYMPQENDTVIGIVTDVAYNKWIIDINSPYNCILSVSEVVSGREIPRDLRRFFKEGDLVSLKIRKVDEVKNVVVEGPRKLSLEGRIVIINPKKVPRVIGGKRSMIEMLREKTGCRINVGQNGIIWIDGEEKRRQVAVEAMLKIEQEAHLSGLTDNISRFLDQRLLKNG